MLRIVTDKKYNFVAKKELDADERRKKYDKL
jgi:hypothetical protein